uniref:Importin N-terminal domain-containing protein n=1 Tax=Strigamia maritima TaxID=126957 RepID=T1IH38_STRMM
METTLKDVHHAINALHHDPNTSDKEKASAWLAELQKSIYAWKTSDELLQQNLNIESSYFAAQTMRTKIQFSFHELPPESHPALRQSLLHHITRHNNPIIVTQLSLALADFALQMTSWEKSTRDLIDQMTTNLQLIPALFEILTVLPEELYNRSLRLGATRREEVLDEFIDVAPKVLELLQFFDTTSDHRIQSKIIKCLSSWLNIDVMPTEQIAESRLFNNVIHCLGDPTTCLMIHEAASDCVCAALVLIEDRKEHRELANVLFEGVHALSGLFNSCDNVDKCSNFCRIFTEFAESFLDDIIDTPDEDFGDFRILDALIDCLTTDDHEMAEITFNFWYRLAEQLEMLRENNEIFKPYIVKLITSLCRLCRLESSSNNVLLDDNDDFSEFRTEGSELIKHVVFIVGSFDCFRQMFNDLKNQMNGTTWNESESSLFVMCAVASDIPFDENEFIPQIIAAILNLPDDTHVAVRFTSIRLIGEFSNWVEKNSQTLEPILNFLLKCLDRPQLSIISSNSLRNICAVCTDQMIAYFDQFLPIIRNKFNVIPNEAVVNLLTGAALILCKMPDAENMSKRVILLCRIPVGQLFQAVKHDGSLQIDPSFSIDCLTAVFRHLHLGPYSNNRQEHPCAAIVKEVLSIVSSVHFKFQREMRVIEKCCDCIRFLIRCMGRRLTPLMAPLVENIVELYRVQQHSEYLYLGGVLVDQYGKFRDCHRGLIGMLESICQPTFSLLEGVDNLRNHPHIVRDFFRLCVKLVQGVTLLFLQSPALKTIFQCGLSALCALDDRNVNSAVMSFFYELVRRHRIENECEECRKFIVECLVEFGGLLMTNLINACVFVQTEFVVEDVADVIYELVVYDRKAVCLWLKESLELAMRGSGNTATQEQLRDFYKAVTGANSERDVCLAMRTLGRLYR